MQRHPACVLVLWDVGPPRNNEAVVCVFSVLFGAFAASWGGQELQGMAKRSQEHFKIQTKLLTGNNKQ